MMSGFLNDQRAQQMGYSGRYPVNEMWEIRQTLIEDFSRSCSNNRYIGTIERQCVEYLKDCKRKRSVRHNLKSSTTSVEEVEKRNFVENKNKEIFHSKYEEDQNISGRSVENKQYIGRINSCFNNYSDDKNYTDFSEGKFDEPVSQPTNAELFVKDEPSEEYSSRELHYINSMRRSRSDDNVLSDSGGSKINSDRQGEEIDTKKIGAEKDKIKTLNQTEKKHEGEIITEDIILKFEVEKEDRLSKNDDVNSLSSLQDNEFSGKDYSSGDENSNSIQNTKPLKKKKSKKLKKYEEDDNIQSGLTTSKPVKKKKSEKIKNYKEFVNTVSRLVNLKKDKKSDLKVQRKSDQAKDTVCEKLDETDSLKCNSDKETKFRDQKNENSKSKMRKVSKTSAQKEGKTEVIRRTRSSSRSAKISAAEKISSRKREMKELKLIDSKPCSSCKIKKKNKYHGKRKSTYMSKEDYVDEDDQNNSEEEVTSTSRQVIKESKKRKSVSSDDVPLSKYSKTYKYHDEIEFPSGELREVDTANELEEDSIVHSNCEENLVDQDEDTFHSESDFILQSKDMPEQNTLELFDSNNGQMFNASKVDVEKDHETSDLKENDSVSDVLNECENISDSSLIIVEDSEFERASNLQPQLVTRLHQQVTNLQPQQVTSLQPQQSPNDLDSINNNKDDKIGNVTMVTQTPVQELWEYFKCDFCDFLVSKKKIDHFRLMEEHLESTKHNAASVVKVRITDGELKPIFVKKEHAILFSLEKASVLPYCPTCCTVMPSIWTVQLHSKYKHGGQKHKDIYCLGKVDSVVNVPIPKKINMCKQCGQRKLQIQKHWKSHNHFPYKLPTEDQIALYSCSICHRHFESFFSALSHAVVHSQESQKAQNVGVKVTYLSKSNQILTLLPREKTLTSGRAIEMLNQARAANKTGQWTRAQRKEFEIMATEWKRCFKQY